MTEKQKRTNDILLQRGAKLEYKGKSKDVYALPNGNVLLVFGDGFTGTDGKEDPGGNTNIGTKVGLGAKNLEVSTALYALIEKELGIPTHNVRVDFDSNMLEATRVQTLGGGLEFISRNIAWGSYLKRYPNTKQGTPLTDFVEVSVKDDEAGDPFFTRAQHIKKGFVSAKDFDKATEYTKQITKFLTKVFADVGMELVDIKVEFGKDSKGKLLLIDEISPGSMRVLSQGKELSKDEIYKRIMNKGGQMQPQVLVVMGSDSDLATMNGATQMLDKFDIKYQVDFVSAHRTPEKVSAVAKGAAARGIYAIIAGAGGAAHLPGMLAAETTVAVIGVPVVSGSLFSDGTDALLSIVQMPGGVPVATVGINRSENAGILAAQIIGASNPTVRKKLEAYKKDLGKTVHQKSETLRQIGHKEYLKQREKKKNA